MKDFITFDEFQKVDVRIGIIKEAEKIKKSDKLLKLQVDFGEDGMRQIVAGIGKQYYPAILVNKSAAFVLNLKPIKLMGVESNGMILATTNASDTLSILTLDIDAEAGSVIS